MPFSTSRRLLRVAAGQRGRAEVAGIGSRAQSNSEICRCSLFKSRLLKETPLSTRSAPLRFSLETQNFRRAITPWIKLLFSNSKNLGNSLVGERVCDGAHFRLNFVYPCLFVRSFETTPVSVQVESGAGGALFAPRLPGRIVPRTMPESRG